MRITKQSTQLRLLRILLYKLAQITACFFQQLRRINQHLVVFKTGDGLSLSNQFTCLLEPCMMLRSSRTSQGWRTRRLRGRTRLLNRCRYRLGRCNGRWRWWLCGKRWLRSGSGHWLHGCWWQCGGHFLNRRWRGRRSRWCLNLSPQPGWEVVFLNLSLQPVCRLSRWLCHRSFLSRNHLTQPIGNVARQLLAWLLNRVHFAQPVGHLGNCRSDFRLRGFFVALLSSVAAWQCLLWN